MPRREGGAAQPASRPSFRPRPLDHNKQLPIIKSSKDLRHEDDVVVNRALPAIASGVDPAEEEERHLQQALLASVFGANAQAATADIPVPIVNPVTPPPLQGAFRLPPNYILFDRDDLDLIDHIVDYDADFVDDQFAAQHAIDLDLLERCMDTMEKTQARSDSNSLLSYSAHKSALSQTAPSDAIAKLLYHHWLRRRENHPTPFLRIFQPPPDPKNQDPAVAFRPRERDAASGIARRMNTYDNFRKAVALRDELRQLRQILRRVLQREKKKSQLLMLKMFAQRLHATADGAPRMETVNRAAFTCDTEPVVIYASNLRPSAAVLVPVRGLTLPDSINVVSKKIDVDKNPKKSRRRAKPTDRRGLKEGSPSSSNDLRALSNAYHSSIDKYGFDYHGNSFLKHMRYFAGGFANYGVSPYDHRVFAAATERNTVRATPREPHPITLPNPNLKFARFSGSLRTGGKTGPRFVSAQEMAQDILGTSTTTEALQSEEPIRKIRRTIRARGRVGRGGRIMFDRVIFEPERGVRAASYPANVEMGGVYTAGIPFHESKRVAKSCPKGDLGEVLLLGGGDEMETASADASKLVKLAKELMPEMEPMTIAPDETVAPKDVIKRWPRRTPTVEASRSKFSRWQQDTDKEDEETTGEDSDDNCVEVVPYDEWEKLPAYAPRNEPLVSEL